MGKSCYPLSPREQEELDSQDQLVKILNRIKIDELDTSFLSDQQRLSHLQQIGALVENDEAVDNIFDKTSSGLLDVLKSMLQFNPHFRPTASQLMKHKIFDEIRQNELIAPQKIVIDLDEDSSEYQCNYFTDLKKDVSEHAEMTNEATLIKI